MEILITKINKWRLNHKQQCNSKHLVGRCHMDLLINMEIGSPTGKNLLYSIQELIKVSHTKIIKTTM